MTKGSMQRVKDKISPDDLRALADYVEDQDPEAVKKWTQSWLG